MAISKDTSEKERQDWVRFWGLGSLAIDKIARLTHCLNLANQIEMNGGGFDIHIQGMSPSPHGGVTTSVTGHHRFDDTQDLEAVLYMAVEEMKESANEIRDAS